MIPSIALAAQLATAPAVLADCTNDAMIVFDGSGSMAEAGPNPQLGTRIADARVAMHRVIPQVSDLRKLGLIIYGPRLTDSGQQGGREAQSALYGVPSAECSHIDMRFGPSDNAGPAILSAIDALSPDGNTALTDAVREAASAVGWPQQPGTVVLITDGAETCGGAPCQLATELAGRGLLVHVIGFRVPDAEDTAARFGTESRGAQCLADRTGGTYTNAQTVDDLIRALQATLGCPLFGGHALPRFRG